MEINRTNLPRAPVSTTSGYGATKALSPLLAVSETANTMLQRWQVGQQLDLLVLQVSNNIAKVKIDGIDADLQGAITSQLKAGQIISARVDQGAPHLKVTLQLPKATRLDFLNTEIRTQLPQQQNLQPFFNKLDGLITTITNSDIQATPRSGQPVASEVPLLNIRKAIYQSIPVKETVTGNIRSAIENSAIFLHHQLKEHVSQQRSFPENNLNTQLLRLANILRLTLATANPASSSSTKPTPQGQAQQTISTNPATPSMTYDARGKLPQGVNQQPVEGTRAAPVPPQLLALDELLRSTEGVLAKIQTHQLHMLRSEELNQQVWFFDLPVKQNKNIDIFEFLIYRDAEQKDSEYKSTWQIQIRFNLEGLGEILARVRMRQNKEVDIDFIAESSTTARLFSEHMLTLSARLSGKGISPGRLNCSCDVPDTHAYNPALQQAVIEDKI